MSLPLDIDKYQKLLPLDSGDMRAANVPEHTIRRVERIRGLYAYWMQFPSKTTQELAEHCRAFFDVQKSQAYDDVRLLQLLMGNLQSATREFWRWKINAEIELDLKKARMNGEWRAVASMQKNLILNNRTDKPDELELQYDKIVPQQFVPTDDPTVLGVKPVKDLRGLIERMNRKYSGGDVVEADYEEVENE